MTAPDLPAELKAALDDKLQGLSRNDAAERAALISQTYRGGGGSGAIRSETDALAYALARMPATYAAVTASLNALREITPDFAPESLLDVGAGPGTATWAAAEVFSSLRSFALLDANAALRALALDLGQRQHPPARHDVPARRSPRRAGRCRARRPCRGKLHDRRNQQRRTNSARRLMWAKTRDTLLIVEPGTPAGYARIIALRAQLIASGAHVAAPCPHDGQCPLEAPDWCHFTSACRARARTSRSRAPSFPSKTRNSAMSH